MNKITVGTLFSGYDSQCMALDRLRDRFPVFSYELLYWCEIDKFAAKAHDAVYPQWADRNLGDICNVDVEKLPCVDLLTYSFPCGLAGTKIRTEYGYKNIEDIVVGDKVTTHNGVLHDVVRTMTRIAPSFYEINATGCRLKLTENHPMFVLRENKEQWIKVKDLKKTDMLSYCVPSETIENDVDKETLWLLGRYVADGWINKYLYNSVEFAIAEKKEADFLSNIPQNLVPKFRKSKKSCWEYRVADPKLQSICAEFGCGSKNKHIPAWVEKLPNDKIKAFLDGYFAGDGHVRVRCGTKIQMFSTVSEDLFLGVQRLLLKVYKKVCSLSIRKDDRKKTFNDSYNGQISFCCKTKQVVRGNRVFVKINSIQEIRGDVQVYNMEVDTDNSYTCNNVNVHNCQAISTAGKQKGLAEGTGTTSSLLWECRKIIAAKKPKWLLMENVKALLQKKFIGEYHRWVTELETMGYETYTEVLNAKDYGVPQNRERVFAVSILGGGGYHFPKKMRLERHLADVLEDEVDEKYYLSPKMEQYIFRGMINGTVHTPPPISQ